MKNNRVLAFMIYEIYKKYSDEDHPLNSVKIQKYLKQIYNIDVNRGTLKNHIDALSEYGIEIKSSDNFLGGKYLVDRQFEKTEVYLLSNAIHSAHFIPKTNAKDLIEKLLDTQSDYFKKQFHNTVHIANPRKTINQQFFYNIELLLDAINRHIAVSFSYMHYELNKKLKRVPINANHPDVPKIHTVYPYYVVTENDNTYLICKNTHHMNSMSHYRVDKIADIQLLEKQNAPSLPQTQDPYEYTRTKSYMYGGEIKSILMHCHKKILDDILDQFGMDIMLREDQHDKDYFYVRVNSTTQGIIYFALQYLNFCEILEPKEVRDEIMSMLEINLDKYKK